MELRLHLKSFNQKVWASMFKQCLRILVTAESKTLAGKKALIQKLFMQSPGYREMAASPSSDLLGCWSFTAFSLSNTQPFGLSCSGLAIKEHIPMNQQLSYCHYSCLGHWKICFLHHFPTYAKFSNKFILSAAKVTLTVGVSTSTLNLNWTLLIYKPWWLSLRWPYFVQIGAHAYL